MLSSYADCFGLPKKARPSTASSAASISGSTSKSSSVSVLVVLVTLECVNGRQGAQRIPCWIGDRFRTGGGECVP